MFKRFFSMLAGLFGRRSVTTSPEVKSSENRASQGAVKPNFHPHLWHARPDWRSFGMSAHCRRLSRSRRLRAAGLGGDKI